MKILWITLACWSLATLLRSQDSAIWQEDFSRGLSGWTFETEVCGHFDTPLKGSWELAGGSSQGAPLPDSLSVFLDFISPLEYSVRLQWNGLKGEAQGQYDLLDGRTRAEPNLFLASLLGESISAGSIRFQLNGDQTRWAIRLDEGLTPLPAWARLLFGLDTAELKIDGLELEMDSRDGEVALRWQRRSPCPGLWTWQPTGEAGMGIYSFPGSPLRMNSPSRDNGVAMLHADFLHTLGDPGKADRFPFSFLRSHLISPPIDLRDVDRRLALHLYQHTWIGSAAPDGPTGANGQPLLSSLSYSTDGGKHWSDPIALDRELEPADPLRTRESWIPLPAGIRGQDSVQLRFTWSGNLFFWMLDDLSLVERPDRDLAISPAFVARSPNHRYPRSQFASFGLLADLRNDGQDTARNLALSFSFFPQNDPLPPLFTDTLFLDSLLPDARAENLLFAQALPPMDLPPGTYTGRYLLSSDEPDARDEDNTYEFAVRLTDTLFAKATETTRFIAPDDDLAFTYGNCFFLPNGQGYFARTISFTVFFPQPLPQSETIQTLLLEWDGDLDSNLTADPGEYREIARNALIVPAGTQGIQTFTLPVDIFGQGIALQDDKYLLAMVQYAAENGQPAFFAASGRDDYLATYVANDSLGSNRYASALSIGGPAVPGGFDLVAFGFDVVPRVQLSIGNNPDLGEPAIVGIPKIHRVRPLQIFPNPAAGRLYVELPEGLEAPSMPIRIFDGQGRLVSQGILDTRGSMAEWPLGSLPNGFYTLQLLGKDGIFQAGFIKVSAGN